jgi:hypothetical protein
MPRGDDDASRLSRASNVVLEDLLSEHGEVLAVTFTDTEDGP